MTPSFDYRIDSLIQAMGDIVLPAIDADKSLAREQAQLIIAHLRLIKLQLPDANSFNLLELRVVSALGRKLIELAGVDPRLAGCKEDLESALRQAMHHDDSQKSIRRINRCCEEMVRTLRLVSDERTVKVMTTLVLAHAKEPSLSNRIWFASNGFDSEHAALPGFDSLFTKSS